MNINNKSKLLTFVTTTHLIKSAPSTYIIEKTIKSVRSATDLVDCRHIIYYDAPFIETSQDVAYRLNLDRLCAKYNLDLIVRRNSGLKSNYLHALSNVETPYIFFLEHDWIFNRRVELKKLLQVFENHVFVNFVKFNKYDNNSHLWWDHFVEPEDSISILPLTRTSCWTNNPHVVRVSKWKSDWLTVIGDEVSEKSFGVEEKLYWAYNRDIFNLGFQVANRKWGCYIYGDIDSPKMVKHINGSLSASKILEPVNKIIRFINREMKFIVK